MSSLSADQLRWRYRAWRYRLKLEKHEVGLILDHLKPGDTAIDIGAHKGAFTWWIRQATGRSGRVIAFEPQPVLAHGLAKLVQEKAFNNVTVENLGLSSEPGTLTLHVPTGGPSPGATFETRGDEAGQNDKIPIKVTTVDQYATEHDLPAIRLLKIDVEGHELEVFRGAAQRLQQDRPNILFECELRHRQSDNLDEVFTFLNEMGYQGFLVGAGELIPIQEFDPQKHQVAGNPARYFNNFWFRTAS